MSQQLAYTHFAYFDEKPDAEHCVRALSHLGFLCAVNLSAYPERHRWLVRAAREVDLDHLAARHAAVESVVCCYHGTYDGGEATILWAREGEEGSE